MRPDKSEVTARAILDRYIEGVRADFASSVEAVVLIGSLATGGYVPGPGDIDQITILQQDAAGSAANRLQACIDAATAAYGGAVHMAPTREEILACHRRLRRWSREVNRLHPRQDLANRGEIPPRLAVQVILSRAIWHHFYATGSACFVKNEIAGRIADEIPGYLFQAGVDQATRVRVSGSFEVSPEVARTLTTWGKRYLQWGADHEPDNVPGASVAASKPKDEAPG